MLVIGVFFYKSSGTPGFRSRCGSFWHHVIVVSPSLLQPGSVPRLAPRGGRIPESAEVSEFPSVHRLLQASVPQRPRLANIPSTAPRLHAGRLVPSQSTIGVPQSQPAGPRPAGSLQSWQVSGTEVQGGTAACKSSLFVSQLSFIFVSLSSWCVSKSVQNKSMTKF